MPFQLRRRLLSGGSQLHISDPGELNPLVWIDTSDTSTLFQERTGASATTAVAANNDPVGTIVNKGSLPLYFITDDDTRRALWLSSFSDVGTGVLGTIGALNFDGVNDAYYAGIADAGDYDCIADGFSMLSVARFRDNNAYQYAFLGSDRKEIYPAISIYLSGYLCGDADAQAGIHFMRLSDTASALLSASPVSPAGIDQYYEPTYADKNAQIRLHSWDRSTGIMTYRGSRTHSRTSTGKTAATNIKYFFYGADWAVSPSMFFGGYLKGAVPEILLFPKLSQEQEYAIADYLVNKWNADAF